MRILEQVFQATKGAELTEELVKMKKAEEEGDGESMTAKNLINEEEELAHQDELDARRQEIRKGVQKSQEEATARYILSYNKRHHVGETKLVVGDKVMKTDMQK